MWIRSKKKTSGGGVVVVDKMIPVMTSNSTPSGVADANQNATGYEAWRAMQGQDNGENDRWVTKTDNGWIQYEFPSKISPYKLEFKQRPASRKNQDAAIACSVKIQTSNDGVTFTDIQTISLETADADDVKEYEITNHTSCKYIRLQYVGHNCEYSGTHYCGLTRLQIYGAVGSL